MTRLSKILVTLLVILTFSIGVTYSPQFDKYVKENILEHETPGIAMIMHGQNHGTGFYISPSIIVTNAHVVGDREFIRVQLVNNKVIMGRVIAKDKARDIALIKVHTKNKKHFTINTKTLRRGDNVFSIGFGLDTWYSARYGTVEYYYYIDSAMLRINTMYVKANLAVLPGHSGSPVFNEKGHVVGIISLGNGEQAYFVPIQYVKDLVLLYLTIYKDSGTIKK